MSTGKCMPKLWTLEYSDGKVETFPGEYVAGMPMRYPPLAAPNIDYYLTHFPVACNGYTRCVQENRHDLTWTVISPTGEKRAYNTERIEHELYLEFLAG